MEWVALPLLRNAAQERSRAWSPEAPHAAAGLILPLLAHLIPPKPRAAKLHEQ